MKRVKYLIFLLPALILLFGLPQTATAETKTFSVTKDTFANSVYNPPLDYRDNNYGSVGSVVVSNEPIDRLGYIEFEDVDLPEGAIIDKGLLKFYVHERSNAGPAKLNVGPVTGDWQENTLTWNNKPTVNQTQAVEGEISLASDGWKEVSLTNLVRQWYQGAIENKGIFIYPYGFLYGTAETDYAFSLKSKESGDLAAKLEVEYHLEEESPPEESPSPSPEEETETEEEVIAIEEASPSPEESPSPSPEAEKGQILGIFTPGQTLIAALILLALIGAGASFAAYARRKPKKMAKKKKEAKPEEEEPEENSEEE